jgi:hypothetical protein
MTPIPIYNIKDNTNGKIYDANWQEIGNG